MRSWIVFFSGESTLATFTYEPHLKKFLDQDIRGLPEVLALLSESQ